MVDADSTLAFALLGLLWQQPQSGYDLRKFFATTPMISFSDSPGAIYPALARLERRGLIRGVADTRDARGRKLFHVTARGRAAFQKWQRQPVTRDDVVRHMGTLMLRFAFMDQSASPTEALRFLDELRGELASYVPTLRAYLKRFGAGMPLSGRLALESGIRGYETHLRWTKAAAAAYRIKGKQS
jgi:DNA-binding PadR family transcriptional regulator